MTQAYGKHPCLAHCGRMITYSFAICAECEKLYGRSSLEWPDWLRFLWNDEQRLRRQRKRIAENEIFMDEV